MRITAVSRNHRRGLRSVATLAGAATLAVTAGLATASVPAQAAVSQRAGGGTPDAISLNSTLLGVSADSATDAWAAGDYLSTSGVSEPLILHWTGTTWAKVNSQVASGAQGATPYGVSAVSSSNAWVAGIYTDSGGANAPLIMQCNGKTCKQETSPVTAKASLYGVSAVSATDAWAVGQYQNSGGENAPLIMQCNGKTCKEITSRLPSAAKFGFALGVTAVSATNAWVVGNYYTTSGVTETLIMHCNSRTCKQVTSPAPSGTVQNLTGVSAVSATNVWAAGYYENSSGVSVPLIVHCSGTTCKQVASSAPSGATNTPLNGVSAISATNAWVSGSYTTSGGVNKPLILHCTSKTCKQAVSPLPSGTSTGHLSGVSVDSSTNGWAVGQYESDATLKTLTLQLNDGTWKPVKSPNGT
jgi:hypothetical protein